jgi:hypothetical protein
MKARLSSSPFIYWVTTDGWTAHEQFQILINTNWGSTSDISRGHPTGRRYFPSLVLSSRTRHRWGPGVVNAVDRKLHNIPEHRKPALFLQLIHMGTATIVSVRILCRRMAAWVYVHCSEPEYGYTYGETTGCTGP